MLVIGPNAKPAGPSSHGQPDLVAAHATTLASAARRAPRAARAADLAHPRQVLPQHRTWSQSNYEEHLGKLKAALAAAGIATTGEPVLARYNGPMTPWFMRRNEIWLAVR